MRSARALLFRSAWLGPAMLAALLFAPPASAAPAMCTEHGANPQGVVATHLFAKLDGQWVEPKDVCVGVKIDESTLPDGGIGRGMYLGVWNTVDGGFPETHLPPGTEISLGLSLPDGMVLENTFGRWRNATVISNGNDTAIQGRTVPWDYHQEAYFGGPGLDCNSQPVRWPSTFTAYIALNPLKSDRTPDSAGTQYAGGFWESNTVGAVFPKLTVDSDGRPTGLEVRVSGCGDGDPATFEGFLDGFMPISVFRAVGITDQMIEDTALLQDLLEVRDTTTGADVKATFQSVHAGGLVLDPVPGVALPAEPGQEGLIGVRTTSAFSYSEHTLVERAAPAALRALATCRAGGGTPAAHQGRLVCRDTTAPAATLRAGSSLRHGRPLVVSCSEGCAVTAELRGGGKRLAIGRAKSARSGNLKVPLKLTAAGRRGLAAKPFVRGTLHVTVKDASGNRLHLTRSLRITR